MKIAICNSLKFAEDVKKIKGDMTKEGHEVFLCPYLESPKLQSLLSNKDYLSSKGRFIKKHFDNILKSDAILVVNIDKDGIKNYIGGCVFAEIMFAFYNNKKIFFFNPIPEINIFADEIKAVKPTVINGDLSLIS